MAKDFDTMEDSNRSSNPSIHDVSLPQRRVVVQGGLGMLVSGVMAPWLASCAATPAASGPLIGFKGITTDAGDALRVPEGYIARAFAAWMIRFWSTGTFSGGISTPRSPRATITPSTTSRMRSSSSKTSGFSSFARTSGARFVPPL